MSAEAADDPKPLVSKVEIQGGNAVFAHSIHNLTLNSEPSFTRVGPFDSIPPRPANFLGRPELTEPLVESLLTNASNIGITALQGMGGVGKSITALAVCHDLRIQEAFPDGIVWLTIGKQSVTLSQRIEQVAVALNQRFQIYNEAAYRSLLRDKAVLIVLDDVWTLRDAEPFLPPADRSRLLYTSRDCKLAASLSAESHEVGILKPEQARSFLLRCAKRELIPPPEPSCRDILGQCKGLILALAMIGARLREQTEDREWDFVLHDLKQAKLRHFERTAGYDHETLYASIAISVDALDPVVKQAYLQLAVLLEDMAAPEALLQALWGGDADSVHCLARRLVDRSLATRDTGNALRLHDLQLDYLRGEHPYPATLSLLHATLLRSLHIIERYPEQFSSQMIGRLLPYAAMPGVEDLLKDLDAHTPRPRLRSLRPALQPAGNGALRLLEGHTSWVSAVALSADGRLAVSASDDHTLRVWDLDSSQPSRVLEGHTRSVNAVALSADGRRAVSASADSTLRVWDLDRFLCLSVFTCDTRVLSCSCSVKRIAAGDASGRFHLFQLEE